MQNRHPADRLADVRSEIKRLTLEEETLRAICSSTLKTGLVRSTLPSSAHRTASAST